MAIGEVVTSQKHCCGHFIERIAGLLLARKVKYEGFDQKCNNVVKHIKKGGNSRFSSSFCV